MAILIAYYSRAKEKYFDGAYRMIPVWNTKKAAKAIAELTGGTLFRIEQSEPYSVSYQTRIAEAKKDLQNHARPALVTMPENLDDYGEIYLGYPNYWCTMPMAVYTFLEHFDLTGKTIHPFCTHEGSGISGTSGRIRNTCDGAAASDGFAIPGTAAEKDRVAAEKQVLDWLEQ